MPRPRRRPIWRSAAWSGQGLRRGAAAAVQPHRAGAVGRPRDPGVRAADRAHRGRAAAAGAGGRQPRSAARFSRCARRLRRLRGLHRAVGGAGAGRHPQHRLGRAAADRRHAGRVAGAGRGDGRGAHRAGADPRAGGGARRRRCRAGAGAARLGAAPFPGRRRCATCWRTGAGGWAPKQSEQGWGAAPDPAGAEGPRPRLVVRRRGPVRIRRRQSAAERHPAAGLRDLPGAAAAPTAGASASCATIRCAARSAWCRGRASPGCSSG